jgi:hypothetical protein
VFASSWRFERIGFELGIIKSPGPDAAKAIFDTVSDRKSDNRYEDQKEKLLFERL